MSTLRQRHRARSSQGEARPSRACVRAPPMPRVSTLALMRSSPACPTVMTSRSCGLLARTRRISRRWPTGLWTVASRRLLWHPRESIGFRCARHWKCVASTAAGSVPSPLNASRDARAMFWPVSGSRPCPAMGYSPSPFVLTRTAWRCAPCDALAPNSSNIAPPTSSTCKKHCCRCISSCHKRSVMSREDTGQRILRAIVAGECDPHTLAAVRNYRCKKEADEIALALTGTWRTEHLFVLVK
jgi:hypothetical protein